MSDQESNSTSASVSAPAVNPGSVPPVIAARPVCSQEEREHMICEAAYFYAQRRGFAAGGELDDWLRAEAEIDHVI